jgi:hypothetical protein
MKFYIVGPKLGEEDSMGAVYTLITEKGEALASHFCSSISFAKGDLEAR